VLDVHREEIERALGAALAPGRRLVVEAPGGSVSRLVRTYDDAPAGEPCLVVGSSGYLEVALPLGRADARLGLARGAVVTLELRDTDAVV
jgi:S-adenosylmethionine hydrolase